MSQERVLAAIMFTDIVGYTISNDILAMPFLQALHHLREITGEITTDEIPSGMYGTFCLGM